MTKHDPHPWEKSPDPLEELLSVCSQYSGKINMIGIEIKHFHSNILVKKETYSVSKIMWIFVPPLKHLIKIKTYPNPLFTLKSISIIQISSFDFFCEKCYTVNSHTWLLCECVFIPLVVAPWAPAPLWAAPSFSSRWTEDPLIPESCVSWKTLSHNWSVTHLHRAHYISCLTLTCIKTHSHLTSHPSWYPETLHFRLVSILTWRGLNTNQM